MLLAGIAYIRGLRPYTDRASTVACYHAPHGCDQQDRRVADNAERPNGSRDGSAVVEQRGSSLSRLSPCRTNPTAARIRKSTQHFMAAIETWRSPPSAIAATRSAVKRTAAASTPNHGTKQCTASRAKFARMTSLRVHQINVRTLVL